MTRATTRRLLALAVALAAPAALRAGQCAAPVLAGAPSHTIFVDGFESGDTSAWNAPALPAFSLSDTVDLGVEESLSGLAPGDHVLELRWSLPGGFLYQSVATPVSTVQLAAGAERTLPDYPFPVAVKFPGSGARLAGGSLVVDGSLPVAGTQIPNAGLSGKWRLDVLLDGSDLPCASAEFRMDP